jgi:hypothetical protein
MKRIMPQSLTLILAMLLFCPYVQGTAGNILRIDGPDGWTKHLEVDQGSKTSLVVLATKEGYGTLCDRYPDGCLHNCSYYFPRCDRLPFYADMPGRHVLSYVVNGKESNSIVIDVKCTSAPSPVLPRVAPQAVGQVTSIVIQPQRQPVYLGRGIPRSPAVIQHSPVGSHIMNYQNGIVIPRYGSQYYFGRDFSLGTVDGNYMGTPFLTQSLADP